MKTIVLGVTGSIAAYKAADLAGRLAKTGHDVHVVMTANATGFVAPLTFQTLSRHAVTTGIFDEKESWHPGHIALADRADLLLIAPATANVIAKLANGIADDALTSIALASLAPLLIAPAMNGKMWAHPATRENVARLKSRGAKFIGPAEGLLACGYEGLGRLWDVEGIARAARSMLEKAPRKKIAAAKPTKKKSRKNVKIC
ncbi:MAG: flavoprotein [Terrimicrobiaceae bacterium]|nr:phosphopantothenoylcysteine decarboxylase [Terrimicrobiaceae bacterium]